MFTGIIQELGTIYEIRHLQKEIELVIQAPKSVQELSLGDSLAVNGVCLTVETIQNSFCSFRLVEETLQRSSLGSLKVNDRINLELAMKLNDRLGGHFVQGHVDGVAQLLKRETLSDGSAWMTLSLPSSLLPFVVEKGSIAIEGISLTIARQHDHNIDIALIPHTLEKTNLLTKPLGSFLNIEVDILAKHVKQLMNFTLPSS